jgi:DNA-binding transcriptional LysR family regulator
MRSLSISQLRALMEVAELGSFSAAAHRLNVSQPAVTLQIRELEARCGLKLVARLGKSILPTAAGKDLIAHAQRICTEAERAVAAMREFKDGHIGRVRVATGRTALAYLLPPVLRRLREQYPNIELAVTTGSMFDIVDQILSNNIDLGFTALPVEGRELVVTPVRSDEMLAILPLSETDIPKAVTPAYAARRNLILEHQRIAHPRLARAWMAQAGFEARAALEFDNLEAIIAALVAGLGMSFLPAPAIEGEPRLANMLTRPLDPPLIRTLGLVERRNMPEHPALCAVRDAILTLANIPASEDPEGRARLGA